MSLLKLHPCITVMLNMHEHVIQFTQWQVQARPWRLLHIMPYFSYNGPNVRSLVYEEWYSHCRSPLKLLSSCCDEGLYACWLTCRFPAIVFLLWRWMNILLGRAWNEKLTSSWLWWFLLSEHPSGVVQSLRRLCHHSSHWRWKVADHAPDAHPDIAYNCI